MERRRTTRTDLKALAVLAAAVAFTGLGCGTSSDADPADSPAESDCAGSHDGPGALVGLDTSTGEVRWTRLIGDQRGTSMSAHGLMLKIAEGGGVEAYDAETGEAAWCRPDGTAPAVISWPTIAVADQSTLILHTPAGELTALDLDTGAERWTVPLAQGTNPRLDLFNGTVIVRDAQRNATVAGQPVDTTDLVTGIFDLASGAALEHPADIGTYDGISDANGTYPAGIELTTANAGPYQLVITAKDHQTGAPLWSKTMHAVSASLSEDIVYVTDQDEPDLSSGSLQVETRLIALAALDGRELWTRPPAAYPTADDTNSDSFYSSSGSEVQAFDLTTGGLKWTSDPGSPGQGGENSESGTVTGFTLSRNGAVVAGFIYAQPPYRD